MTKTDDGLCAEVPRLGVVLASSAYAARLYDEVDLIAVARDVST
jgi:hypothetical protein